MTPITSNNSGTLAAYGKSFQEKLSFLILEDRVFADRMLEVLKIEFLEFKYLQWFVQKIFDYKEKYKTHPTRETIETIIRTSIEEESELIQKMIKDYYASMLGSYPFLDIEFVKNESLDFCRKQKLHDAMIKSVGLLRTNSFDDIKVIIDNALKAGAEIDNGHDYIKDFEKRYVENVRYPIPTGWSQLNDITSGGLGKGEYGIIMGASGSGKTLLMVHVGASALREGKNVVFYTLELRSEVIGQRFDACLSGIPLDELKENKEKVLNNIKNVTGKLIIKHFPKKSVSLIQIRNHLERLKSEGFKPDMVVLDYLDLLKPISGKKELRHELGETYDGFESLCQELDIVAWTGSQCNRSSVSSDVITMEHISEAFNKHFGSYLTIGLARDQHDKANNTGRISILKNRNGVDGNVFNIFMDAAKVDIKFLGEYDPHDDVKSFVNEQEEKRRMTEKYKKYKDKI